MLEDWGLIYEPGYLMKRYKWYRKTNQYPDGKPIDEQRKSLLDTFDQLDYLVHWWCEKLTADKEQSGG